MIIRGFYFSSMKRLTKMDELGNLDIDLISIIQGSGGLSNWERYKVIADLFSSRVIITNPD